MPSLVLSLAKMSQRGLPLLEADLQATPTGRAPSLAMRSKDEKPVDKSSAGFIIAMIFLPIGGFALLCNLVLLFKPLCKRYGKLPRRCLAFLAAVRLGVWRMLGRQKPTVDSLSRRYREALERIVSARLEKESSNEFGEPVFLSHYTNNGVFRHWVLHAHGHKYELRRKAPSAAQIEWQGSTSLFASAEYYEPVVGVSGFCMELYKSSVLAAYSPEIGCFFYSMVGWTTFSEQDIERECWEVFQRFGNYGLFYNNCQHFLRALADEIVTTRAPDWQWLMKNSPSGYTYGFKYPLPYEAIGAATAITRLKRAMPHLSPEEQREADKFIASLEERVETAVREVSRSSVPLFHSGVMGDGGDDGGQGAGDGGHDGGHGGGHGGGHHDYGGGGWHGGGHGGGHHDYGGGGGHGGGDGGGGGGGGG
ncbi:hypothetical protein ARSEF1564_006981 [Beauveria bassiana]